MARLVSVAFIAGIAAALWSAAAPAVRPAAAPQPVHRHGCGYVIGARWSITVPVRSGGTELREGNTYAVFAGSKVIGCAYATMRAAMLTRVPTARLSYVGFPNLGIVCKAYVPPGVTVAGTLSTFGRCWRRSEPVAVSFSWSPAGDPQQ